MQKLPKARRPRDPIFLVDGDEILFRYSVAFYEEHVFDDGIVQMVTDAGAAAEAGINALRSLGCTSENTIFALSGRDDRNWRKGLAKTYKGNRTGRKPLAYYEIALRIAEVFQTVWCECLEADDIVGILATHPDLTNRAVIVSQDKDMRTLPVFQMNPNSPKPWETLVRPTEEQADWFHMFQTLAGDKTDNYKGCPGMGEKTAPDHLAKYTPEKWWKGVVAAFTNKAQGLEEALTQARQARILRFTDLTEVDGNTHIKLWTP